MDVLSLIGLLLGLVAILGGVVAKGSSVDALWNLAAFLIDRHIGRAAAQKSLHIMIIDEAMAADEPQPGLPLDLVTDDPLVRRALLMLQQNNLRKPWNRLMK